MNKAITRSDLYQAWFKLDGDALSFKYLPFWIPIINTSRFTLESPQVQRRVILKCSRKVAKSTNAAILATGFAIEHKYFNTIITLPTDAQVSRFSTDILKGINRDSVVTDVIYYDPRLNERQVKNKSYLTGSRILLANIYVSPLSARGIIGDCYIEDEMQDTPEQHASIVEFALKRSKYKYMLKTGTPMQPENRIQTTFDDSTGCEWAIKCRACGHWNVGLGIKNMGLKGIICEKCHKRISTWWGEWVEAHPGRPFEGFSINELMIPPEAPFASDWDTILYDYNKKDEVDFHNEVLGLSFSDNIHPITLQRVVYLCDSDREYVKDPSEITKKMKEYSFAALDWAVEDDPRKKLSKIKSYTMLTIGSYDPGSRKININFVRRYYGKGEDGSPDDIINDVVYWVNHFNVLILGMDYGAGHKENIRIIEILGFKRTMEFEYVGELAEKVAYYPEFEKWVMARSTVMTGLIDDIVRKGEYKFAKYPGETSEYAKDLTNVYRYHDTGKRKIRYGKSGTDDFFQNLVILRLVKKYHFDELEYRVKK